MADFTSFYQLFMVPKSVSRRLIINMELMNELSACACAPGWQTRFFWKLDKESKLSLDICINDDVIVVGCKGRIYGDEATALSHRVTQLLPQARHLVLDLSRVEAIDGAGLGKLVDLFNHARGSGCAVKLVGPRKQVRELLELTNLVSVFEIHGTLDQAILASRGQLA